MGLVHRNHDILGVIVHARIEEVETLKVGKCSALDRQWQLQRLAANLLQMCNIAILQKMFLCYRQTVRKMLISPRAFAC